MLISKCNSFLHKVQRCLSKEYYKLFIQHCGRNVSFEGRNVIIGGEYISIGKNSTFQRGLYLTAWNRYNEQRFCPKIRIGKNCDFGAFNHITCINEIVIGNGVLTGKWVTISDNNHGDTSIDNLHLRPKDRPVISKGKVIIGNNVFIGDKATVLSGVVIGEGSVIGANCVVAKNVPPYSIVVGNPSKILNNK